ncbi:DUF1941-domain-containing protein [Thermothelomyces heterothallicus CBS 203.75]
MSASNPPPTEERAASVQKIQTLLSAKDDTSRFVGLALLKSVLDNTPELRNDEQVITDLWASIPPKFLARLIKSGIGQQKQSDESRKESNDMLDLAVSVLHTFTALLPESAKQDPKLVDRIPQLVACLVHCSDETTRLTLEALVSLVSRPDGARVFTTAVEDLSPLTEIAAKQPLALDTLLFAWLNAAMAATTDKSSLRSKIDSTVGSLVASFKGTDAVTLLSFLANLLPRLNPEALPSNPKWLPDLGTFIRNLVASRPTSAGRAAFTNLSATLLELYPFHAPQLLFADQDTAGKSSSSSSPFSYLLINLILVDLRASLPTLLSQLNTPEYPPTAYRLTSAFNVISHFIGYLLRALDAPDSSSAPFSLAISPDRLLSLRKSLTETLSLTTEYLRDRWDASVAGAMGLHPEARAGAAVAPATGATHFTLAWDSIGTDVAADDPLVLAAVRALALWAREDDGELLRREVGGLCDMLVDLYRESGSNRGGGGGAGNGQQHQQQRGRRLDFRRAVLVAFEGVAADRKGRESVLSNGGWEVLVGDLEGILQASSAADDEDEAARGIEIVRVLMQLAETERPGPREAWMDLVTHVAAWDVPEAKQSPVTEECQVAVLQLVTTLLINTHPGVQKRYVHSTSAVLGIAHQLQEKVKGDRALEEALDDVVGALITLR